TVTFKEGKEHEVIITTSDGHQVVVHTHKMISEGKYKRRIVTGIYPHGVDRTYFGYDEKSPRHIRRVEKKTRPDGAELFIHYYRGGGDSHDAAFLKGRVHTLTVNQTQKTTFYYDRHKRRTRVETDLGRHTYHWDENQRIIRISTRTLAGDLVQK